MKSYYRVMLGKKSMYAEECFSNDFMGVFGLNQDLSDRLPEEWQAFNKEFVPIYLSDRPEKSRIAAGLACGFIWTISKGIRKGDFVISPDGNGRYRVGEVTGDYFYNPGAALPHRRSMNWHSSWIERSEMSDALRNSTGSVGTVCNISSYQEELDILSGYQPAAQPISADQPIEDPAAFALEQHLEEFLVSNWNQTELSKEYNIYEEEGDRIGQQYATDTGRIDILAISKDRKRLLVIELKKGRASDVVVGQILRYMGYVQQELAEEGQTTRGLIIALDDDQRIRRALSITPNVDFYRYQLNFKLVKA